MLNVAKIKKLFRKGVKISGISFPPTDDKPATDILFTIDGVLPFNFVNFVEALKNYPQDPPRIVDNVDRCVMCGTIIPEGWQVCPSCERSVKE